MNYLYIQDYTTINFCYILSLFQFNLVKMWDHPITKTHLDTLSSWGWSVISPVSKLLACKDSGNGALADVTTIVDVVKRRSSGILPGSSTGLEAFEYLSTYKNQLVSNRSIDSDSRKIMSYHKLYCITINSLFFIGGLVCGSLTSSSHS